MFAAFFDMSSDSDAKTMIGATLLQPFLLDKDPV